LPELLEHAGQGMGRRPALHDVVLEAASEFLVVARLDVGCLLDAEPFEHGVGVGLEIDRGLFVAGIPNHPRQIVMALFVDEGRGVGVL
jgi:hypothetical protein